ncbi:MAG: tRNA1(Val) (adenine(37)-N6)-methyltransferase [Lachnospiraceae bacterium]|nr:tRNA1(Val) (adenine(37)-N6)-methyltransferase [Lachnospiraceae bacterium]
MDKNTGSKDGPDGSLIKELCRENERIDDIQRNGYRIIQDPDKFCFGVDAVLLSDFARVGKNETVLDIGTGTGIIPILLEAKTEGAHFTGIDIQKESTDLAKRSVILNGLEDKIDMICGDINDAPSLFEGRHFDVITTNPPYMIGDHGEKGENIEKAIARHEICCTFEDIARESSKLLKDKGRFYLIHRPFRLVEIFSTLTKYRLEPKQMRLVHPYADREPNMVLIEAVKGGRSRLKVLKPLVIHKDPSEYTDEIYSIYGKDRPADG